MGGGVRTEGVRAGECLGLAIGDALGFVPTGARGRLAEAVLTGESGAVRLPELPHPHLIVLRSAATVVISCLIGQAGWAAAFIGGEGQYRAHHALGALVTLVASVVTAVVYVVLRLVAGPVNVALAVVLAALVGVQYALGEVGSTSLHIFLGVLIVMLGTALTSWTYRHHLPEAS